MKKFNLAMDIVLTLTFIGLAVFEFARLMSRTYVPYEERLTIIVSMVVGIVGALGGILVTSINALKNLWEED